jgi:hypothetical protein
VGQVPAILYLHGHFHDEGWSSRARPEVQAMATQLARMGALVLAVDMVGWGDSKQIDHDVDFVLALQLWNNIRALDFVTSLPEVDPARVAVTGASGGGTQTILLAAVDERVALSAPVVMVSSGYPGLCGCEVGMPIRDSVKTNNAEIAALVAPRPQILVSDGDDWTQTFPDEDFSYLRRIYGLYGAADGVENVHLPTEGHDYGPSKRAAVYDFFASRLGLDRLPLDPASTPPEGTATESNEALTVFDELHPLPAYALTDSESVAARLFVSR